MKRPRNADAWAIGTQRRNGFHVRRVVWGLLMAQCEQRDGEQVRKAVVLIEDEHRKRRSVMHTRPGYLNP
jgi:hypothetical protein